MAHALVVGGEGMLKEVALVLAGHDNTVSFVTRSPNSLQSMIDKAGEFGKKINLIQLVQDDTEAFANQLNDAVSRFGPFTVVVNWFRTWAVKITSLISDILKRTSPICRLFMVIPSSEKEEEALIANDKAGSVDENILIRKIFLGVKADGDSTRYPTREEINRGVIDAIRNDLKDFVIGDFQNDESQNS